MRCTAFKYKQTYIAPEVIPELEFLDRFDTLDSANAAYAKQLATHTVLVTNYPDQESAWDQEVTNAEGNTPVQNQLSQNTIFAGHAQFFPSVDLDVAWNDYMDWIKNDWSGYANSFLGYHGWWTNHNGNTRHPNANISNLL